MNISRLALTVLLLAPAFGCSPDHPVRTASERQLLRVWSAPGSSVEERAEAVNRCFPPGIPISSIIALLGTNHAELRLVATANRGKFFEGGFTLTYGFGGGETVTIQAWGPTNANPLGAGFSDAKGWTRRSGSARTETNNPGEGQPAGAAAGSQPFSLETKRGADRSLVWPASQPFRCSASPGTLAVVTQAAADAVGVFAPHLTRDGPRRSVRAQRAYLPEARLPVTGRVASGHKGDNGSGLLCGSPPSFG